MALITENQTDKTVMLLNEIAKKTVLKIFYEKYIAHKHNRGKIMKKIKF